MSVVLIKPKTSSKKETKEEKIYDAIIIGGGPAGLTAGIYLSRARINTLLIEKALPGGQAILTEIIENYPGFPLGIAGPELMQKMEEQAVGFGLKIEYGEVAEVKIKEGREDKEGKEDKVKMVKINNQEYRTLTIILASGADASKLEVPGEEELRGRGVSYCATCDAPFFKDQKIVVVGGGDTAIEEALYLTKFVREATIIHRRDRLRATKILQERVFSNKKINFAWDSVVTKILGKEKVEGVLIQNKKTGKEKVISCQGVFVFVGNIPNSKFLNKLIKLGKKDYILTDDNMMTSQEGIYACGDVRKKLLRQVVTACGEGATAAFAAQKYIEELKGVSYK
ncbi:Thioredoxin reductase [subsurface metagenome]